MSKDSIREPIKYEKIFEQTGQFLPQSLITLYSPNFFNAPYSFKGNSTQRNVFLTPKKYNTQSYNNYNELIIYSGVAACILIICSIVFVF